MENLSYASTASTTLQSRKGMAVTSLVIGLISVLMWKVVEEINRGDIVVFWYPDDPSKSYIKRVVGLPGEEVMVENGKVLINGSPLDEPYMNADYRSSDSMPGPIHVKDHHYFVLGDNRKNSSDSRY